MINDRKRLKVVAVCAWSLAAIAATVAFAADSSTTQPGADYAEATTLPSSQSLPQLISRSIDLLQSRQYEALIDRILEPSIKVQMAAAGTTSASLANDFANGKAQRLLEVLKAVKDATPTLNADGTEAAFATPSNEGGSPAITFVKVDGVWYLKGH